MKKLFVTLFLLTMLCASCAKQNQQAATPPSPSPQYNYTHQLQIGKQTLMVEISTTPAQMQQGLSGRTSMADDQGMLFDFGPTPASTPFWMKDMNFNLDFVWIAGNKVVGITPNAPAPLSPTENLPLYYPPEPVNQVLEVNAGWAKKNNVSVGDGVNLAN